MVPLAHPELLPRFTVVPTPRVEVLRTRSGEVVPPIVMGTSPLGSIDPTGIFGARERRRALRLLDGVTQEGCRAFDLARSYQLGGTERVFGEWLKLRGDRDRLFLISKIGHPVPLRSPNRLTPEALGSDLRRTLDAIGVESLDLLLLHRDHPAANLRWLASYLEHLRDAGIARYVGASNWSLARIESLEESFSNGLIDASSPQFSLAEWKSPIWSGSFSISGRKGKYERRLYARRQLATFAYSPLGRGFFGDAGRRRTSSFRQKINHERKQRSRIVGRKLGATPAQVALAYLLNQPFPVFPVTGVSRVPNMRMNLEARDIQLSAEELRWLEQGDVH
ncbi:MAG: aldo/keto reductase [Myxococcales bacterium]|nr:aldo/keto reductase [Myxococcales bacterium]